MASRKTDDLLFASFVAIEGAQIYSAYLPSYFTIRRFGTDPEARRDIHIGEAISSIYLLLLAVIVGALSESWMPVVFGIGTIFLIVPIYEHAIMTAKPQVGYGNTGQ